MKLNHLLGASALALAALTATNAAAEGAGYIQLHGAYEWGYSINYNPGPGAPFTWSDWQTGGAVRAASVGPNFSLQADAWTTLAFAGGGVDGLDWGTGLHATWRSPNDTVFVGPFATIGGGGFGSGLLGNLGLEAVFNVNNWRFYWQGAMVRGLTGPALGAGVRDIYTTLAVSYFVTPNFFITGNIGADRWSQANGDGSDEIVWGAKLEFKPDASPVSFFVAYEAFHFYSYYGLSNDYDRGVDNIVFFGIRIPLGDRTLRSLQDDVGLSDLNPMYGDLINR